MYYRYLYDALHCMQNSKVIIILTAKSCSEPLLHIILYYILYIEQHKSLQVVDDA